MNAKILLLALAGSLAAATLPANAQVYSQNIVGYVNVTNTPGQYVLLSNPLDNGTNTLATLLSSSLPSGSLVQVWNGTAFSSSTKLGANWSPNLVVAPGQGFFLKANVTATNTFVGSVNCVVGGSITNGLSAGVYSLSGSQIPYADTLNSTNIHLSTLPSGSIIQVWNGTSYSSSTKLGANWSPNLSIGVGQGFFIKSTTATNWIQSLPGN